MLVIALRGFNLGKGAHATVGSLYDMPEFIAQARINCGHVRAARPEEVVIPPVAAPLTGFEVQDPAVVNSDPKRSRGRRGK